MASFRKKGNGWVAEIARQGVRQSKSFATKAEAVAWAAITEANLISGKHGGVPDKPFSWLLEKYSDEVSANKKGGRWEIFRLAFIGKMDIGSISLSDLQPKHITAWRDQRLKSVSESTVLREWKLLAHVCNTAVNEWQLLTASPMSGVKRPKEADPRDRRISEDEIERVLLAAGYDYDKTPETLIARVGAAFLFAIETAMRAGEIAALTWNLVDFDKQTAKLLTTKNGKPRSVPLSKEAMRLLKQLPVDGDNVFNLNADQISSLFRKIRERTLIDDLHFHDTRHEAITRLSKKLDVLALARMTGHRDLKMLMVYYNETAEELAKKLD